jgi:hypothetical protein
MNATLDYCTAQVKRLGSYPGYPKNNGTACLELAKALKARCSNSRHAEAAINAILESDRTSCPTVYELSVFIDQTRSNFVKEPEACDKCIAGWVHVLTLNTIDPSTGKFKSQIITKQQHDALVGLPLREKRQQLSEGVVPCTCERGQLSLSNQQKYAKENEGVEF